MKNQILGIMVVAGCVSLAAPVLAGSGHHGKGRFMEFFDSNGDNLVTMEEFNGSAATRFDRMDEDGDGVVTAQEFGSYIGERRAEWRDHKFASMDSDKDGQVSQDEYVAYKQQRAQRRFQYMDTNKDGKLSKDEFRDHKKNRKHGHHGKGRIFSKLDADNDGQITREESLTAWRNWFKRIDANNDQVVSADEVAEYRKQKMNSWK